MDQSDYTVVDEAPARVSGQWMVKGTRILADGVPENADDSLTPKQIVIAAYEGRR